jgi:hypothetical protein
MGHIEVVFQAVADEHLCRLDHLERCGGQRWPRRDRHLGEGSGWRCPLIPGVEVMVLA